MIQVPIMKFVFDRHKRATATKAGSVELLITLDRQKKYVTTGVRCLPKQWRNGNIVGSLDASQLNETLNMLMSNARKVVNEMVEQGTLSLEAVAMAMKRRQQKGIPAADATGTVAGKPQTQKRKSSKSKK